MSGNRIHRFEAKPWGGTACGWYCSEDVKTTLLDGDVTCLACRKAMAKASADGEGRER